MLTGIKGLGEKIIQNKSHATQASAMHKTTVDLEGEKQKTQLALFIVESPLSCIALSQLVVKRSFTQKHQRMPLSTICTVFFKGGVEGGTPFDDAWGSVTVRFLSFGGFLAYKLALFFFLLIL